MGEKGWPGAPPATVDEAIERFAETVSDGVARLRNWLESIAAAGVPAAPMPAAPHAPAVDSTEFEPGALVVVVDRAIGRAQRNGDVKSTAIGLRFSGDDMATLDMLGQCAANANVTRSRLIVEILNVVVAGSGPVEVAQ